MTRPADPAAALSALLRDASRALRTGVVSGLPETIAATERLIAALPDAAPDGRALAELRVAAQENQRVLSAALRGIRAARTRMANLRQAAAGTGTYDAQGQRQAATPAAAFEKRA